MVQQLLESGTNTTGSSFYQDGFHPLHAAALTGNLPFVKMLREAGAKTANRGWIRATELHYAARSASSECVQFFLDIGISVNVQTLHGDTPLHWAAEIGNSDVIKTLLMAGADVNAEGQNANFSPLHRAVGSGQVAAAKQLINAGANVFPQRQGSDYASLIYQLVHQRGGPELLELLLELGYDINETTVLHTATWNHNEVVITQLINHGADISRRNSDGNTALHEAAKIGCTKSVKALLDGGADINERN
ncbi:ankyrin repeat-containing domain protein, partial [Talaromyces proteolyticus]